MNPSRGHDAGLDAAGVPEFSVIITCYFEEKSIDEFYTRLSTTMRGLGRSYEIILVNDGSGDDTFEKLRAIFDANDDVATVIDLYKNSGQAAAMVAGFREARGRYFVFMDSDLQLDPEDLPALVTEMDKGMDVVSGRREQRRDSLARILPSLIGNAIVRRVSDSDITDFGCNMKIFRADLLRAFDSGPFKSWSTVHVIARARRIAEVPINHHERPYGSSGWTFRKLFALNMDNIVRLSQRPFQLLSALCVAFAALFVIRIGIAFFFPDFSIVGDITNGLVLNVVVLGILVNVAILAAIGEFVIRNFTALHREPIYIIREILKK